ncbi:MAG TPA: tail fiber assembly protein [Scandinavium sp.]|jgi:hypothetical protein
MGFVYKPMTGGFYNDELEAAYRAAGTWPGFFIRVKDDDYRALMDGQTNGQMIVPGENGYPILQDRPEHVATPEELIAKVHTVKTQLMTSAATAIAPLQDAADLEIATDEESALLLAWKKYRVQLNRVDSSLAPDIEWPEPPASA